MYILILCCQSGYEGVCDKNYKYQLSLEEVMAHQRVDGHATHFLNRLPRGHCLLQVRAAVVGIRVLGLIFLLGFRALDPLQTLRRVNTFLEALHS